MADQLHIPIFIIVHLKTEINFITKWSSFEKYYSLTELLLFMQMSALTWIFNTPTTWAVDWPMVSFHSDLQRPFLWSRNEEKAYITISQQYQEP